MPFALQNIRLLLFLSHISHLLHHKKWDGRYLLLAGIFFLIILDFMLDICFFENPFRLDFAPTPLEESEYELYHRISQFNPPYRDGYLHCLYDHCNTALFDTQRGMHNSWAVREVVFNYILHCFDNLGYHRLQRKEKMGRRKSLIPNKIIF